VPARRESPPVDVDRNLVYVGHEGQTSAYDLDDGSLQWNGDVGARGLTLAGDTLYVSALRSQPPTLNALDPADGQVRWSVSVPEGLLSDPTVHDGLLYVETSVERDTVEQPLEGRDAASEDDLGSVGRIEARSPVDGSLSWAVEHDGQLRVDATGERTVLVRAIPRDWVRDDEALYALDAATGAVRWRQVEDVPTRTWCPGGVVYCSHPNQQLVRARDPVEGTVRWERSGDVGPAVRAAHDGVAVCTTRTGVFAVEEATGTVVWHHEVGRLPQPVDAVVDPERRVAYAAIRDRPSYLAGGSTSAESTTVVARGLDDGERRFTRTCPYYSSGRLALGTDAVYVRSWRGGTLEAGCTALDADTGAITFRSAIDGTRIASPPTGPESPTLVVGTDTDPASDALRLHALTAAAQPQVGESDPDVVDVEVVSIDHAETIGIAVTLDSQSAAAVALRLRSADGTQSRTLAETAVTEPTEMGRLQVGSVERSALSFDPAVCEIDTGSETMTVDVE
jgi:outer membrane protein assembly factor BamB